LDKAVGAWSRTLSSILHNVVARTTTILPLKTEYTGTKVQIAGTYTGGDGEKQN